MILFVACVRDAKTDVYSQPMFFVTRGVAIRSFSEECESTTSALNKHPQDYAMFQIGTYDDNSGALVSLPQPQQIALAMDFKKEQLRGEFPPSFFFGGFMSWLAANWDSLMTIINSIGILFIAKNKGDLK